jgi:TadE-like protein
VIGPQSSSNTGAAAFANGASNTQVFGAFYFPNGQICMSGGAAIEFGICATIFLTAVSGTVDIGLLLYTEFELDTAANAGAQYAVNNPAMVGGGPSALNTEISNPVNNLNGQPAPSK